MKNKIAKGEISPRPIFRISHFSSFFWYFQVIWAYPSLRTSWDPSIGLSRFPRSILVWPKTAKKLSVANITKNSQKISTMLSFYHYLCLAYIFTKNFIWVVFKIINNKSSFWEKDMLKSLKLTFTIFGPLQMSTISQLIISKIEKTTNLRIWFKVYCKFKIIITQNGGLIQYGVNRTQIFSLKKYKCGPILLWSIAILTGFKIPKYWSKWSRY
jgi:hypothetical protein